MMEGCGGTLAMVFNGEIIVQTVTMQGAEIEWLLPVLLQRPPAFSVCLLAMYGSC
jgi:hypothetical protein